MEVEIVEKCKDSLTVNWTDPGKGMGRLTIKYIGEGKFITDAEYMDLDTVVEIIAACGKK